MKDILYILSKKIYIFSCGGLLLCWFVFGPLDGSRRHRNIIDLLTVLQFRFVRNANFFFFFFATAHIKRVSETFCRVGTRPSSQCSYLNPEVAGKAASRTECDAAVRDSRDGCKFSRSSRKEDLLFRYFFLVFFFPKTCTHSSVLSLPPCLFYLVRLQSIGNVSCLA